MNDATAWLAGVYAASPPLFWVAGSILAYALGSNILWLLKSTRLGRSPLTRLLREGGRFFLLLGVPYLALGGWPREPLSGWLSLADVGLVGIHLADSTAPVQPASSWPATRWLDAAGAGLGMGLAALVVLALAWKNAHRGAAPARLRFSRRAWWLLVVDIVYLEAHWAFYRAALGVALDDVYAGVFVGLGLIYVEWGLNPFWRRGWRRPTLAPSRWLRAALALVSALLFLFTRNLWICLGVRCLLELPFWYVGRARTADAPPLQIS